MSVHDVNPTWTYEHYVLFPDDGNRYEIIDGERFVTPAPTLRHQQLSARIFKAVDSAAERLGTVLYAPCDVLLSPTDIVQPDVLYVSPDRSEILTRDNIQGAPDLLVEILSPSTRKTDEVLKRNQYELFGVREYWIVDPELETINVYRFDGGSFDAATVLSKQDDATLRSPLLPELALSLQALFA